LVFMSYSGIVLDSHSIIVNHPVPMVIP
jgi:hypothetical protein